MESIISIKKGETQDQFDKRQIRTYVQLIKPILKHPEKTLTEKVNVLTPTFFNIYNLPFLRSPNIEKIRVKAGPKTDYFSYILSSCTNRIAVSNSFFSLICSQPRDKQIRGRDFLFTKYFLNNLPLTVFMQNTLSKLIELLQ